MRRYRKTIETGVSVLGVLTIFAAILIVPADRLQLQIVVVLAGILALEAGIWGLTQQIMPSDRQFVDLRVEGEHFIDLVRDLNQAAIVSDRDASDTDARREGTDVRFNEVLEQMHQSVDRMGEVAGKAN